MDENPTYHAIGLMSGTSLDGLDLALCSFRFQDGRWEYAILEAETKPYTLKWTQQLNRAYTCSGRELSKLNFDYGHYLGRTTKEFCSKHSFVPDFVASHGHTIFHLPAEGYTLQIGHGAAIAASSGIKTICDFRSADIAYGGQGAPLVPAGDELLFSEYQGCLNLGGFSNISLTKDKQRIAFDICPVNIVLNQLAERLGKKYDDKGLLARSGQLNKALFQDLNELDYYSVPPPKSLGKEWIDLYVWPLISAHNIKTEDILHTLCEHIALQIGKHLPDAAQTLVTGGGALNDYLIERIKFYCRGSLVLPEKKLIEYKEALIFAFLGVLRMEEQTNSLHSVTGARQDSCGGAIYLS